MKRKVFYALLCLCASNFLSAQPVYDWQWTVNCDPAVPEITATVTISNINGTITDVTCSGFDALACTSSQPTVSTLVVFGMALGSTTETTTIGIDFLVDGQPQSDELVVPAISPLEYTVSSVDDCTGSSGEATIDVTSVGSSWSTIWTTSDLNVLSISGISGGNTVVVQISDLVCGTSNTEVFNINSIDPISVNPTQSLSICEDSEGELNANVEFGSGSFDVSWTGPYDYTSSSADPNDIQFPGIYTVVVTDDEASCGSGTADITVYGGHCPGDFDCDGVSGTSDLIVFLGAYNNPNGSLRFDLNFDGLVDNADLLLFLGLMGSAC